MPKPIASLSLDLDDKWSYLKTHGDPSWENFPSYLDVVVPRVLDFLRSRGLTITFFVVGQDAARWQNRDLLASLAAAGHEIGNHSFHHEPWLHRYEACEIENEIARAEDAIFQATGTRPIGFRGPGFSFSRQTFEVLVRRGYAYDASTFPTFVGPLAQAYYFKTARLTEEEKQERSRLFGTFRDGFRPLRPYRWGSDTGQLLEVPVTTMPIFRLPIHASYLLYLRRFSKHLARMYFQCALVLCRVTDVAPSILLHPLDFLGCDDDTDLGFFPAMNLPSECKIGFVGELLDAMSGYFECVPMKTYARQFSNGSLVRRVRLDMANID